MNKNDSNFRMLGKTDIQISPIGLGTMELGNGGFWQRKLSPALLNETEKSHIVQAATDSGINWFDTYLDVEKTLVSILKQQNKAPGQVVISTKWYPMFKTAKDIKINWDNHIKMLGDYPIDLYYVHLPVSFSSPEAEMEMMADLVEAGKIRSVGVSNFNEKRMRRAFETLRKRGIPLAANQVRYNLLHRNIETNGVLSAARELGLTIVAHTPLCGGLLTGKYHKDPALVKSLPILRKIMIEPLIEKSCPLMEVIERIAVNNNVTAAQVAMNWTINFHSDLVVAIPGATSVKQVEANAQAMCFSLTQEELNQINEYSKIFL
jgi:aryl-alcohol dehydrogenase-like predicted oxidoreductase